MALRLLFDEDFDQRIVRGLRARVPAADLVTVQEASADDEWCGQVRYLPL
ncbi:MAG: hypothetical protein ACRDJE_11590 [Dehalococcoidia bacterium]